MTTPIPLKLSGSARKKQGDDTPLMMNTMGQPWKVLIVDDEDEIHKLTRLVLADYRFLNRYIEFHSAYSRQEAIEKLTTNGDFAVVLLDVVMETDDAGLQVAKEIREVLHNRFIRIILRTGQPGSAPESRVIVDYDINDYKEKTELTASKLFTTVTTALRSFQDLRTIERNRQGLEKIIDASKNLFDLKSQEKLARGLLEQLTSILRLDEDSLYMQTSSLSATPGDDDFIVAAATGKYEGSEGKMVSATLTPEHAAAAIAARNEGKANNTVFGGDCYAGYFRSHIGDETLLFLHGQKKLSSLDKDLIQIFSANMAIAFENFSLNQELVDTQREVILTLGEVVESRSKESANHVKRVAEYARLLARKLGLDSSDIELIHMAAPMHDVGKIGIPDAILHKPAKLTSDEYDVMKTHSEIGRYIFQHSTRPIMQAAGIIAHQHHEKWNGQGYPLGLKENAIHMFGRIIGIVDVFDALICRRCYKEPWPPDDVRHIIEKERGEHFDPQMADLLLRHFDEFLQIHQRWPDA
ncbi:MAG: DUF3369 domain-containing protein [Deltaproteobacteria bacterium]|nr:DUF3369 domain-containing protein [Deltaproteobacteria bacterium]